MIKPPTLAVAGSLAKFVKSVWLCRWCIW